MAVVSHVKRYRMECTQLAWRREPVYSDVHFLPWQPSRLGDHAYALWQSFRDEPDTMTFPSLGHETGCRDLLHAIASLPNFCPAATWLAVGPDGPIGSIQGLIEFRCGEIQNLGVIPGERGRGIAGALLRRAVEGYRDIGCRKVSLEVAASNDAALGLYRKFGFRPYKTVYLPHRGIPPQRGQGI
jgi:GNAT superfamily N-acetyltransferase